MPNPNESLLHDSRVDCWSLMTTMAIGEYLALVDSAYKLRGGLAHQREPLKTTSGRRIRARMVEDIKRGAVLPPLVVGVVIENGLDAEVIQRGVNEIVGVIREKWISRLAIIDGMQRTTALLDAAEQTSGVLDQKVRVEIWIARNTDSLIYRMLVLNTGQVPWNLKKQLAVVFSPLVDEIRQQVDFERLLSPDKFERRYKGGEFSPDSLIEAYLAFGLRRTEIDTQETLADEFSRLDMAEAIAARKYNQFFYPIVQTMVDLDRAFSRLDKETEPTDAPEGPATPKFSIGRNIFDSQPARIGFVVACSITVLGRLGMDRDIAASESALRTLRQNATALINRLKELSFDELDVFLALDVLSERLAGQKRSAVGRQERAFFESAFKVLVDESFAVPSMEVCWRA